MKIGFLITGRLKSSRLPKKVILDICGRPLFAHMCDRIKRAKRIDQIILCTSTNPQDDSLAHIAQDQGIACFRGSEKDVLLRLNEAAIEYNLDYAANITADCPLIDPLFIDMVVESYQKAPADLIQISSVPPGQGPFGIDVSALNKVCAIKGETETEVWADYFRKSGHFKWIDLPIDSKFHHSKLKTTLDYPEDYTFMQQLFEELYVPGEIFLLEDILALVKRKPMLLDINSHCREMCKRHIRKTATPVRFKNDLN